MKSVALVDRSDEIKELKQKLEKLTATVKSNSFKGHIRIRIRRKAHQELGCLRIKARGRKIQET